MDLDAIDETSQRTAERREQSKMSSVVGSQLAIILSAICLIGSLFAAYIVYLAAASPKTPSLGGAGPVFSVICHLSYLPHRQTRNYELGSCNVIQAYCTNLLNSSPRVSGHF